MATKLTSKASVVNTQPLMNNIYYYWKPHDRKTQGRTVHLIKPYVEICKDVNIDTLISLKQKIRAINFKYCSYRIRPKPQKKKGFIRGRYNIPQWVFPTPYMLFYKVFKRQRFGTSRTYSAQYLKKFLLTYNDRCVYSFHNGTKVATYNLTCLKRDLSHHQYYCLALSDC